MGRRFSFDWLTLVAVFWAVVSPICLGLGLFFAAFYDSPIDPRRGMGVLDYLLIWSVLSFPFVCVVSSLGVWFLKKRRAGAAKFAGLLPIIPLIPIIAMFGWANSGNKGRPGDAIQVSPCISVDFEAKDGYETTGCGVLQVGMSGTGILSATTEAHNWDFRAESGQVRITLKNDGKSCPQLMVLDSQGRMADGFDVEDRLRLCSSGMVTTSFIEFRSSSIGPYLIRVFNPEAPGAYWISVE